MNLNRHELIGRLGGDPMIKELPSGSNVVTFNIATSYKKKQQDNGSELITDWHKVECYGKLADVCGTYLKKGSLVYISGRHAMQKYKSKTGEPRVSSTIKATEMLMLDKKSDNNRNVNNNNQDLDYKGNKTPF